MTATDRPMPLFDAPAPPLSRKATRETSREARDHIEREGVGAAQREIVLALVRRRPGSTSAELARVFGGESDQRHMVARRLPELADAGLVYRGEKRPCIVSPRGLSAVTWLPVEEKR